MVYGSGTLTHTDSQWRHTRSATSGQPSDAATYAAQQAADGRHYRHLKSMKLLQKSDSFNWPVLGSETAVLWQGRSQTGIGLAALVLVL